MQISSSNLLFRGDTFLGVCEALGEDFGFNPFWLRAALGIGTIWNPLVVISVYLAAGAVVAFSRLISPNPRSAAAAASADEPAAAPARPRVDNDEEALAVAA